VRAPHRADVGRTRAVAAGVLAAGT